MIKKWLYKLRYLLLILSSVLGLLWLSSSFGAYEIWVNSYNWTYSTSVLSFWQLNFNSLDSSVSKKLFAIDINNFFFWNDDRLYEIFYSDSLGREHWEWYLPNFFLCNNNFDSTAVDYSSVWICDSYSFNDNYSLLSSYLSTVDSNNYYIFWSNFNGSTNAPYFCVSTDLDKSVCFDWWYRYLEDENWLPSNELNIWEKTIFNIDSVYLQNSPFIWWFLWSWQVWIPYSWSKLSWLFAVDSWYTNSEMIAWYEGIGFTPALCYWWFSIDNIFNPWEKFEDFTWYVAGQGASVFDLYNLYSGSFSSLSQFLSTVLVRYQNNQINSFITEPKALLMIWSQLNVAWFKPSSVEDYCNLLINNNNNKIYTWNSVDALRVQSFLTSTKISNSLRYWSGGILYQSSQNWISSWNDIDFDPDTFFSSIFETIDNWLEGVVFWSVVWLIPSYIILFLLAIIFIRIISH